jgi:hypothetical protein
MGVIDSALQRGVGLSPTGATAARAAPSTTYVGTIGGFDFRSLDYRTFPQMVFNSGGGVFPSTNSGANLPPFRGLEASVDLPGGANVTRLDFYYRHCGGAGGPTFYFGAYAPAGVFLRCGHTSDLHHRRTGHVYLPDRLRLTGEGRRPQWAR